MFHGVNITRNTALMLSLKVGPMLYLVVCNFGRDLIITNSAVFLMFRKRKGAVIKPVKNWRTKIHSFPARTCTCIFLKYNLTYKLHLLMLWTL